MTETQQEHLDRLLKSTPDNDSTADKAKNKAQDIAQDVGDTVENVTDKVQAQVSTQVAAQKEKASDALSSVADALRQTGDQLKSNDQGMIANYTNKAAAEIEQFAGYLRTHDMEDLMVEAQQLARRQPAVFLGGAFALGVLASRFFKSSKPQPRYGRRPSNNNRARAYPTRGPINQRSYYSDGARYDRQPMDRPTQQYGTSEQQYNSGRPQTQATGQFNNQATGSNLNDQNTNTKLNDRTAGSSLNNDRTNTKK